MLQDGDKGVIVQRDGATYAITPHLPCGLVTPQMLRKIAAVAERFSATLKCTSAQRIAIIGLREQDIDAAWEMLGSPNGPAARGHATGAVIRSIRACPGTDFCKKARQDALGVGLELDRRYHGQSVPGKMKIGVSGCGYQCCETAVKDIGLVGGAGGWMVLVGGSCGSVARLGRELTDREVPTDRALALVEKTIQFYREHAEPGERLGDLLGRVGMVRLRRACGELCGGD
ncbi:NAD(P)/FAD-dependent oxidoreductase [Fontivita pretiosa]|uniref:NAD(P)/FAD-dependent oxidoreductase n=1 Tax=Fontivita pretiosa TaxID=2989684 RepID=UPI003D170617